MKLSECPVRATADVIDGKWKPMIVNALKAKPLRFGQLLRALPEASRKVATEQLRELEREGIISRTAFGNRWERVEYSLTGYGRTLVPVLTLMADWGVKHQRRKSRLGARAVEHGSVNSKTIRKLKNQRKSSTNSYPPTPVGYTGKPDEAETA
jgi:DNA-binding HxlR family transcriptional regulator